MKKLTLITTALLSLSIQSHAVEFTYTEADNSGNNVALGYPVPTPIDSLTPIDGFRTYNSLNLRHQQLAAESSFITEVQIGNTFNGRPIFAYQLSDNDSLTHTGEPEASALINSGIHAREWQTPEAVTGYIETLFANENDQHVNQFLLENLNLVIIPVLNIDGFLQTQRYPTTVTSSEARPRDGRMRRKNMRNVDESLATTQDNLGGIDLNRNNAPFWATNLDQSSNDVSSLVHHGTGPGSEPEIQALQEAAVIAGENRLRFYTDTHSFTQVYFTPFTSNTRRNLITERLASAMRAVNNFKYRYQSFAPSEGIGSTDEYFADTYQIPSYTLELEPANSGADYGGFGVSHDGFILPNSEVARMREETANAAITGLYMMTALPFLQSMTLSENGNVLIEQHWQLTENSSTTRTLQQPTTNEVVAGKTYQLRLTFNKPMRAISNEAAIDYSSLSDANGMALSWLIDTGSGENETAINTSSGQWLTSDFNQYKADTYQLDVTLPDNFDWQNTQLLSVIVNTTDMVGQLLDTNPATISDWQSGHWEHYENTTGEVDTDLGGIDRSMRIIDDGRALYSETPTSPTPDSVQTDNNGSSGGGSLFTLLLMALGIRFYRK